MAGAEAVGDGAGVRVLRVEDAGDAEAGEGGVAPDGGGDDHGRAPLGGETADEAAVGGPVEVEHAPVDVKLGVAEIDGEGRPGDAGVGGERLDEADAGSQGAEKFADAAAAAAGFVLDGVPGGNQGGGAGRVCTLIAHGRHHSAGRRKVETPK